MRMFILRFLGVNNLYMRLTIVGTIFWASPGITKTCEIMDSGFFQSITYPSGKTLSVIGHTHGITADVMNLARLADDSKNSNEVYLMDAIQTVASLKNTLKQYREEVAVLKSLIQTGSLNFIALEYGDQTMQLMAKNSQMFLPMTQENLKVRGLTESQLIDDAFLIFAGPTLYLTQKEPELMKNVKVLAIEDDELMQRSLDMQSDAEARFNSFSKKPGVTDQIKATVSGMLTRAILEYDLHHFLQDDWIFDQLKSKISTSLFEAAQDPIVSALVVANLLRQRDIKSSPKILAQDGTGILLIGSAHFRSMANIFKNDCLIQSAK